MKYFLYLCLFWAFSCAYLPVQAQKTAVDSTATFKVFGNCEQCKDRIEGALKAKGIRKATWDVDAKMLSVTFNPAVLSLDKIHSKIAAVGHDTEKQKAKDAVYRSLPACCLYRPSGTTGPVQEPETTSVAASASPALPAGTIRGVVLEENHKGSFRPLEGASVVWLGTQKGTATGKDGVFELKQEEKGGRLVISYAGFQSDTVTLTGPNDLKIILGSGKLLQEVSVTGKRGSLYKSVFNPFQTTVMTQRELFKAACCNLSESFETNPSVDVAYSDAVTGSKQIQLLGLSGIYTQLTVENLPGPRGLATPLGLNSIAGPWVESIQLTKGTGSVVNGYESIAGQINVELKKPATAERLYLNAYRNNMGKGDLNLNLSQNLGKKWATAFLLHDDYLKNKTDFNGDGFRDLPTGNLFSGINRWQYTGSNGWMGQFGLKALVDSRTGGMMDFDPSMKFSTHHYGLGIDTRRYEAFGKIGYVFPQKKYKSFGLQLSAFDHTQNSYFGQTAYDAHQQNFYSNFIYQSIIGSDAHKFKAGLSFLYDGYHEDLNAVNYRRSERVPGAFFEYTYNWKDKLTLVAGLRGDQNSLYGFFATPRWNLRYQPAKGTTVRASVGRGQRTANIFAENSSVLVSARKLVVEPSGGGKAYGLEPEVAWNKGLSVDQKFRLMNREATFSVDFYRNDFTHQVVVDLENPRLVKFYNLQGKSFSNSFQAELAFVPVKNLEARLAYRFFDVRTTYGGSLLQRPFTAKNRAFANLAYDLKGWKFDYTVNYIGEKRLPSTEANPEAYRAEPVAPSYVLMNAQISKSLGKKQLLDLYVGGENLTNFFQKNAVLAAGDPFGPYFDASLVWGPVAGRQLYAGFRFTIK